MDNIDKQLIRLLQENARSTISVLSNKVGLSMPAVSERVKRLEQNGIIKQFTALLNPDLVDKQLVALVHIGFENPKYMPDFIDFTKSEPDILECFKTTGHYEFTLKVQTKNTDTLENLLNRIKSIQGVNKTHSIVVLSTVIDRPSVTVD